MHRRELLANAVLTSALATLWRCGAPLRARGDAAELGRYLEKLHGSPVIVFLWAPWSRSAVELEPTIAELAHEVEPFGAEVVVVAFDSTDAPGDSPLRWFLFEGPLEALERFGVRDVPALLTLSREGRLLHTLEPDDGRLDAGDIADVFEAVVLHGRDERLAP